MEPCKADIANKRVKISGVKPDKANEAKAAI